jgi:hypothetical protein
MALNRRNAKMGKSLTRDAKAPAGDGYRSASSGRYVSQAERIAAARARVTADAKRGVKTATWIVDLAKQA